MCSAQRRHASLEEKSSHVTRVREKVCASLACQAAIKVHRPLSGEEMARVVAEKLAGELGQQVVVDNRAGGSGLVGTRAFIKSPPDGYTLFLGHTGSISINPSLYANAGFDPRKDFAPIGLIASMPVALLAHPSFPAQTIGDVVAVIERLNAALRVLVESAEVKQRIVAEGGDPLTSSPEEYAKDIDREETKWGTLVRKLNLKVE